MVGKYVMFQMFSQRFKNVLMKRLASVLHGVGIVRSASGKCLSLCFVRFGDIPEATAGYGPTSVAVVEEGRYESVPR